MRGRLPRSVMEAESWPARGRALAVEVRTRVELRILVGVLLTLLGIWLFIALAEEVLEGDTRRVDEAILLALRDANDASNPIGPGWMEEMFRDYTGLGGIGVVGLVVGAASIYLWIAKRYAVMWLLIITVSGSFLINSALKLGFDRPRPDLVPHNSIAYSTSFPSGHAMTAAATYLTLGILLARLQRSRRQAALLMGMALLLTALVGISRVYVGVHWPSDVIAGWVAGGVWAILCWLVASWLRKRGAATGPRPAPERAAEIAVEEQEAEVRDAQERDAVEHTPV